MNGKNKRLANRSQLRQLAEEQAKERNLLLTEDVAEIPLEKIKQILHELQVHQIELTLQNEELLRNQADLEIARSRYFSFYDLAPVGFFTLSIDGLILEANLTSASLLEMDREEFVKQPLTRFILNADQDIFYHHRKKLLETGISQSCDLQMVRSNGSTFWACLVSTFVLDEGDLPLWRIVLTDITERKRSEEHLRLYQNIVNAIPDRVAFVDTNYRYILVNKTYEHFSGTSREKFVGLKVAENLGEELFAQISKPHLDRCLHDEIVNYQEWFHYPALGKRFMDVSYYPYKDAQNQFVGIVSYIRDITGQRLAEEKLRESEAKHRSASDLMRMLCDNVPDMIWAKDLQKRYIFANKAICANLLNASDTSEPIGKMDMFFAERERTNHSDNPQWHTFGEICRDTDAITMDAGTPQQFDEYGNVQGKFLFLDVRKAPFIDENGKMIGTVGSARDVTVAKVLEQKLRESEDRYRLLYDASHDAILLTVPDGRILSANPAACRLFEQTEKEIQKIGRSGIMDTSDPRLPLALEQRTRTGRFRGELNCIRKNGQIFPAELSSSVFIDKKGDSKTCIIIRDITQRKLAEETLEMSEERFRKLFADNSAAMLMIDPDTGNIIEANKAAENFYGWSVEELRHMCIQEINTLPPETIMDRMAKTKKSGSMRFEFRHRRADGSIRDVEVFSSRIDLAEKNFLYSIIHDISERKHAEEALQASLAEKEVLLREVHHRVKNNMAAIIGLFNLHRQEMDDPKVREALLELSSRVRAMSLVHEKLYRSESLARIDFQGYLQSLISHLRTSFGSPHIFCEINALGVEMPLDLAVPCGMIINELITNALKYAFPEAWSTATVKKKQIQVHMTHDNNTFILSVADNGVGLPPGFDLNTVKSLGLVLVRMLGQHQLGGRYSVDQTDGTRFDFSFPNPSGRKEHA